jgi:hypothetical protein
VTKEKALDNRSAFIQGSIIYLRATLRANLQTAAFATSTIVQKKVDIEDSSTA